MPTIGIPRALLYHKYGVLWAAFFRALGHPLVVGPPTNVRILETGASLAVDETCLSVKIYLGHALAVAERADLMLVPRIVSLGKKEETCVKLWATCDLVATALPDVRILEYTVDVRGGRREMAAWMRLGQDLGHAKSRILRAYLRARAEHSAHLRRKVQAQRRLMSRIASGPRVLLVAHEYNLYDAVMGAPIAEYLTSLGVEVLTSDAFPSRRTRALSRRMSRSLYWTYNRELLGAVEYCRDKVDGIIVLVTFPCGPDSLVAELCQRRVKDVPLMVVILDELQGEAGLRTRLESFVDILDMRTAAS